MLRWSFCLLMLFSLPAAAAPLAGQDDPAYQAAFGRLLAADDPAALTEMHRLAAAGNLAAVLTLPTALTWFPVAADYRSRLALRQINGAPLAQVAARHSPAAALWQGGAISGLSADQLDRALGLYALGEVMKADALLAGWFNHMPLSAPLPAGFADLPAAPMLKAVIVAARLRAGDVEAAALLDGWLRDGKVEALCV